MDPAQDNGFSFLPHSLSSPHEGAREQQSKPRLVNAANTSQWTPFASKPLLPGDFHEAAVLVNLWCFCVLLLKKRYKRFVKLPGARRRTTCGKCIEYSAAENLRRLHRTCRTASETWVLPARLVVYVGLMWPQHRESTVTVYYSGHKTYNKYCVDDGEGSI